MKLNVTLLGVFRRLFHCLLHWISKVQVIDLSIRDEHVFSMSVIYLLEVSTSLTSLKPIAELSLSLSFWSVNKDVDEGFDARDQ